jgi:hypothetical protein
MVVRLSESKLGRLSSGVCKPRQHVNRDARVPIDTWRRVPPPITIFPPYNDRSGDDLSVGGGLDLSRCLEQRFQRSWWLGRAWWHVGS